MSTKRVFPPGSPIAKEDLLNLVDDAEQNYRDYLSRIIGVSKNKVEESERRKTQVIGSTFDWFRMQINNFAPDSALACSDLHLFKKGMDNVIAGFRENRDIPDLINLSRIEREYKRVCKQLADHFSKSGTTNPNSNVSKERKQIVKRSEIIQGWVKFCSSWGKETDSAVSEPALEEAKEFMQKLLEDYLPENIVDTSDLIALLESGHFADALTEFSKDSDEEEREELENKMYEFLFSIRYEHNIPRASVLKKDDLEKMVKDRQSLVDPLVGVCKYDESTSKELEASIERQYTVFSQNLSDSLCDFRSKQELRKWKDKVKNYAIELLSVLEGVPKDQQEKVQAALERIYKALPDIINSYYELNDEERGVDNNQIQEFLNNERLGGPREMTRDEIIDTLTDVAESTCSEIGIPPYVFVSRYKLACTFVDRIHSFDQLSQCISLLTGCIQSIDSTLPIEPKEKYAQLRDLNSKRMKLTLQKIRRILHGDNAQLEPVLVPIRENPDKPRLVHRNFFLRCLFSEMESIDSDALTLFKSRKDREEVRKYITALRRAISEFVTEWLPEYIKGPHEFLAAYTFVRCSLENADWSLVRSGIRSKELADKFKDKYSQFTTDVGSGKFLQKYEHELKENKLNDGNDGKVSRADFIEMLLNVNEKIDRKLAWGVEPRDSPFCQALREAAECLFPEGILTVSGLQCMHSWLVGRVDAMVRLVTNEQSQAGEIWREHHRLEFGRLIQKVTTRITGAKVMAKPDAYLERLLPVPPKYKDIKLPRENVLSHFEQTVDLAIERVEAQSGNLGDDESILKEKLPSCRQILIDLTKRLFPPIIESRSHLFAFNGAVREILNSIGGLSPDAQEYVQRIGDALLQVFDDDIFLNAKIYPLTVPVHHGVTLEIPVQTFWQSYANRFIKDHFYEFSKRCAKVNARIADDSELFDLKEAVMTAGKSLCRALQSCVSALPTVPSGSDLQQGTKNAFEEAEVISTTIPEPFRSLFRDTVVLPIRTAFEKGQFPPSIGLDFEQSLHQSLTSLLPSTSEKIDILEIEIDELQVRQNQRSEELVALRKSLSEEKEFVDALPVKAAEVLSNLQTMIDVLAKSAEVLKLKVSAAQQQEADAQRNLIERAKTKVNGELERLGEILAQKQAAAEQCRELLRSHPINRWEEEVRGHCAALHSTIAGLISDWTLPKPSEMPDPPDTGDFSAVKTFWMDTGQKHMKDGRDLLNRSSDILLIRQEMEELQEAFESDAVVLKEKTGLLENLKKMQAPGKSDVSEEDTFTDVDQNEKVEDQRYIALAEIAGGRRNLQAGQKYLAKIQELLQRAETSEEIEALRQSARAMVNTAGLVKIISQRSSDNDA